MLSSIGASGGRFWDGGGGPSPTEVGWAININRL